MRNKVGCELCDAPANMYCDSDRASLCWRCDNKVHGANFLVAKHTRCVLCHCCQSVTPWTATGPSLPPSMSWCLSCVSSSHNHNHTHPSTQSLQSRVNNDHEDDELDINQGDTSLNEDDEGDGEEFDSEEEEDDNEEDEGDDENQVVPFTSFNDERFKVSSLVGNTSSSSDDTEEEEEEEEEEEDDNCHILSVVSSPSLKRKRQNFLS